MNSIRKHRSGWQPARLAALASLVIAGLALGAVPVAAAAPTVLQFDVYADGPADWLDCGFPVYEVGHDHVTLTTYLNADGSFRSNVLRVIGRWTETNVDTGTTVSQDYARTYFNAFSGTPTLVGSAQRIAIQGIVLLDAGLLTWNFDDGTVITMAGPHPSFSDGIDWCGLLAG
jgi:hypothetical protein